jgi:hypothetical protein
MRYLPTVDLWNPETQLRILSGKLKLQAGQWVKCGGGKPSRFVRTTGTSLWVAHWQGTAAASRARFRDLLAASK